MIYTYHFVRNTHNDFNADSIPDPVYLWRCAADSRSAADNKFNTFVLQDNSSVSVRSVVIAPHAVCAQMALVL